MAAVRRLLPLQFSGCGGPNWKRPEGVKDVAKEFWSGVAQLSRHWARLGFKRTGRSPYYGFHMEHVLKIRPRRTRKVKAIQIKGTTTSSSVTRVAAEQLRPV